MITLFTSTKPFSGHDGMIQMNALQSWSRLLPCSEIVLFGDAPGAAEAARSVGALHVPDVETSAGGVPLLSAMFAKVQEVGHHELFGFVQANVMFLANLTEQIERHRSQLGDDFLLLGRAWNIGIDQPINFDVNWEPALRWRLSQRARLSGDDGFDYCIYPCGRFARTPPFVVGGAAWDSWMIASSNECGTRVIDGSQAITAVHQDRRDGDGADDRDALRDHNRRLFRETTGRDDHRRFGLHAAGWALTQDGVVANRSMFRAWRRPNDHLSAGRRDATSQSPGLAAHRSPATDLSACAERAAEMSTHADGDGEPLVSVVICTYNRADLLGVCLDSLVRQDGGGFEVIVVDNNSTDRTRAVAESFADRGAPVRYVFEPEQGLSPARNRGWREAYGRYVAYVDDECRMPEDWIGNMTATIRAHEPEMLGGPYDACFDGPPPDWHRRPYFSTVWKGVSLRSMGQNEFLAGGNMAIRRDVFDLVGPFDPALGMKGDAVAYGEETAFQRQLIKLMPEAKRLYDPSLTVDHLVRDCKLGIWRLLKQGIAAGRSGWRLTVSIDEAKAKGTRDAALLRNLATTATGLAWQLAFGLPFRKRSLYPYPQNYLREVTILSASRLGHLLEQRRHRKAAPASGPD